MRLLVLAFLAVLSTASAAIAAPTPPPEAVAAREAPPPAGPSSTQIFGIVCFIGGLLALFAVLPDFEDERGGGWDRQEDDEA